MIENAGSTSGPTPKGWLRVLLRLPVYLYRIHMGWLLGHRFLMLTHIGRNSGMYHQTVVEVVRYESAGQICIIASGWGENSQWYKNIIVNTEVEVTLGTRTYLARACRIERDQAEQELHNYALRHPQAVKKLMKFMLGRSSQGLGKDFILLAEQVPLVKLVPE